MSYTNAGIPFQGHSATSEAAAEAIKESAKTLRAKVFAYIKTNGPVTDEQVQLALGMNGSTQRPRRIELQAQGRVRAFGITVKTRSGRQAMTWIAVEPTHEH